MTPRQKKLLKELKKKGDVRVIGNTVFFRPYDSVRVTEYTIKASL